MDFDIAQGLGSVYAVIAFVITAAIIVLVGICIARIIRDKKLAPKDKVKKVFYVIFLGLFVVAMLFLFRAISSKSLIG